MLTELKPPCAEAGVGNVSNTIDVYLEIGQKRVFAGAMAWPGWCRSGRDEASALQALFDSGPRYAHVLHAVKTPFHLPGDVSAFAVVERLVGTTTTDFGAPDRAPSSDIRPVDPAEREHLQILLTAYWQAFDTVVRDTSGKALQKGPRGGGRDLEGIIQHVLGAERSYLAALGWKHRPREAADLWVERDHLHDAVLTALAAAAQGEIPAHGPRGGVRWTPRYFVRRAGWHVLDHVWEIEDRLMSS
jgi:hypothetical protein